MLPWWLGLVLSLLSYLALHAWAQLPLPASTGTASLAETVGQSVGRSLAQIFQYVLPPVFAGAAALSWWHRRQRRQLLDDVLHSDPQQAIQQLSWQQFEQLVAEAYRRKGFSVAENGGGGADGGIDLVLSRRDERILVQCKHWRATKVPVAVVRELLGVMLAQSATGSIVVTAGHFTDDAKSFASGRNIELIDGQSLLRLIGHSSISTRLPSAAAVACPQCGAAMVKRTVKQGQHIGQMFWGCSRYPACRGTKAF